MIHDLFSLRRRKNLRADGIVFDGGVISGSGGKFKCLLVLCALVLSYAQEGFAVGLLDHWVIGKIVRLIPKSRNQCSEAGEFIAGVGSLAPFVCGPLCRSDIVFFFGEPAR
jgi:hypothetical protein